MTHDRYGRTTVNTNGKLTHTISSNGVPQSDGDLKNVVRKEILHYHQLHEGVPDLKVFMTVAVNMR
jgi:hypothetical protein